jgi:hypothetical protein
MNKMIKALQYIWLTIGVVALFLGTYFLAKKVYKDALFFFIITFAGGVMYSINKRRYKRYFSEKNK